jgi:serine/threonine protein kinase
MQNDETDVAQQPPSAEGKPASVETGFFTAVAESAPAGVAAGSGPLPAEFGRYLILQALGAGGMGSVYLARDTQLDRNVALKVPRFGTTDTSSRVERFYREARAMAMLRHPNLCAVHDVGQHQGIHFLTMDYVEGKDLAELLKDSQTAETLNAVEIVRKVALALSEAHQAGIVHRDLKPSNIMIDRRGEPIVMDFGLARREQEAEAGITQQGTLVGSPAYMSPEQVEGEAHSVGPTADVYSLGVVFYQLLCRRLPFEGAVASVLAQVLTRDPLPPSQYRPGVDAGLEAICLRAMARTPQVRYQSMLEFVAGLDRWQAAPAQARARARRLEAARRPALVPGRQHDLFVSYCASDDEPPPGSNTPGWVTTLIDNLDWRLRQLNGDRAGLSVWMDDELARQPDWSDAAAQRLEQTALVLLVLSPGWTASAWNRKPCRFLELLGRHLASERVCLVEADRVEMERPLELSRLRPYPLWKLVGSDTPSILGYPFPKPEADHEYYARLDDLARAIHKRLEVLRGKGEPAAIAPSSAGKLAPGVYLAEVTDDLDPLRDEVQRSLNQYGFNVLPAHWYPRDPGEFREAMDRELNSCLLFVQLLGPFAGKKPPRGTRSYTALQYDIAAQRHLPILQWREPSLDPARVRDAEHATFLASRHVQAVDLELFKREVLTRAAEAEKRQAAPSTPDRPAIDQAFVFINVGPDDLPLTEDLCGLLEQSGCSYALPMHEGRPDEIRQDLEANLIDCDGLIIVYGEITEQWVREQLRQWRKILARRDKPLRALAVYEGPPREKQRLGMRLPKMHVIDCRGGLQEEKFQAFLNELALSSRQ